MYWYSCRPYIPQAVQLSSTYEYIHASTVYSRLECEGGIPPRAHSNREWQSNRIECSNADLVPKGGGEHCRAHSNREWQSNLRILIASRL